MTKARLIASIDEQFENEPAEPDVLEELPSVPLEDCSVVEPVGHGVARRVETKQSPYLHVFSSHHALKITLDSGAEINLIKQSIAHKIAAPVLPTTQIAYQANGVTPMDVVGETHLEFSRDDKFLSFQALVVKELDVDILAGIPFMVTNDIAIRPAKCQIIFKDGSSCFYGQKLQLQSAGAIRLTTSGILRSNSKVPCGLGIILSYLPFKASKMTKLLL